jgi:hypothetical protein
MSQSVSQSVMFVRWQDNGFIDAVRVDRPHNIVGWRSAQLLLNDVLKCTQFGVQSCCHRQIVFVCSVLRSFSQY